MRTSGDGWKVTLSDDSVATLVEVGGVPDHVRVEVPSASQNVAGYVVRVADCELLAKLARGKP